MTNVTGRLLLEVDRQKQPRNAKLRALMDLVVAAAGQRHTHDIGTETKAHPETARPVTMEECRCRKRNAEPKIADEQEKSPRATTLGYLIAVCDISQRVKTRSSIHRAIQLRAAAVVPCRWWNGR